MPAEQPLSSETFERDPLSLCSSQKRQQAKQACSPKTGSTTNTHTCVWAANARSQPFNAF